MQSMKKLAQVLPPFLLFYLIYKPSVTSGPYSQMICYFVILVAGITLAVNGFKNRKKKFDVWQYAPSVLTILIGVSVLVILYRVQDQARDYLWKVARDVQKQCAMNKICPESPPGWSDHSRMMYGYSPDSPPYKQKMYYQSNEKRQTFAVYIHYGPDFDYWIHGGVDRVPYEYIPDESGD